MKVRPDRPVQIIWPGLYIETDVRGDLFEVLITTYVPSLDRSFQTSLSLTRRELREDNGLFDRRIQEAKQVLSEAITAAITQRKDES